MKLIRPDIFEDIKSTEVFFTLANRDLINMERTVPGLDLGRNTKTSRSVTDQNIRLLFRKSGLDQNRICTAVQIHGTHIETVTKPGVYENCDGFVTSTTNLALAIQVADCAAVLIADPVNGVAGAFHAGWRGAAGGIIPKGVETMKNLSAKTEQMRVFISPCISTEMFEIGEEVAAQFPGKFIFRQGYSKPHLDLKGFLKHQLTELGLKHDLIEISEHCTVSEDDFYSYRREREMAGRMLGVINLNRK